MKREHTPVFQDLVLIGGGHAHVTVLKKFGMKPIPGVRITLISRDLQAPYSGMLPGYIAGHYTFDDAHIDLLPLSRFAGARFFHDNVIGLAPEQKIIICKGRPDIHYDVLSINIGSAPNTSVVPGADHHVIPVKPIDQFVSRWERVCARILAKEGNMRIGVVGAGAGGVELILSIQYRLNQLLKTRGARSNRLEYHLFTDASDILITHNPRVRKKFHRVLAERGVKVHTQRRVSEVKEKTLCFSQHEPFEADEIFWVTMASAQKWLQGAGLDVDEQGFMKVDDTLESTSHPGVFAAGDIAHVLNHPRAKSGVFATRQGAPLTRNLRNKLLGHCLKPFRPQKAFLGLISTGEKYAIASRSWWALEGAWVWRWKDWIDQRFMDKFNRLPKMRDDDGLDIHPGLANEEAIKALSATAMRCGGCGAKVGATALGKALAALEPIRREDVLIGLYEPDDAAILSVPTGKMMVHTIDSFRAFIDDPYLFGQVAANHALSDLYAMGAEPQSALSVVTLPYGSEEKVEELLKHLMQGALKVLNEANTALVGGHTCEGEDLSLGFSANGLIDKDNILRKAGMCVGDHLILTKAIGTGTLFAADMRYQAKGRWIAAALGSMIQSNRAAAACLYAHGATACTDVTGFGLLGHLVEMVEPSGLDVEIDLNAIPYLEGADETVAQGILSSLQPRNARLRRAVVDAEQVAEDPRYPLLFDPQTSGGLLASVPRACAEQCVKELASLGYTRAVVIGRVLAKGEDRQSVRILS